MQLARLDPVSDYRLLRLTGIEMLSRSRIFLLLILLNGVSILPLHEAHAQNASVCVKNDEYCSAIEAQVNALFEIAEETLRTKVIPTVEQIETRLGVVLTRSKGTDVYRIHPPHSPHVEFKTPHLVFHGNRNTTTHATGTISTSLSISIDKKYACIRVENLKSALPGGKDEFRSPGRFTVEVERVQPIASVQYMVEGDPRVRMYFSFIYQPCLGDLLMSVQKSKGE